MPTKTRLDSAHVFYQSSCGNEIELRIEYRYIPGQPEVTTGWPDNWDIGHPDDIEIYSIFVVHRIGKYADRERKVPDDWDIIDILKEQFREQITEEHGR